MKKVIAVLLTLNTVFLSGCWDEREINELGLVMAVGIDKPKGSEMFTVTAQIAKPTSAASQGGKGGAGADQAVWIGSAEGKTLFEAIRNLAKFSTRRVMWAHNNIIIIGQSLAEQDITPVVDFFTHNPELRMKTWVAVSQGPAKPYVAAKTGIENIPGLGLAQLFRYHDLPAESVASDMLHLFSDFKSESRQPLVSAIRMKKEANGGGGSDSQVELSGAAVFKGSKMLGFISPEETNGLAWVRKDISKAVVSVTNMPDEGQGVSVEIKKAKLKMNTSLKEGIPSASIDVHVVGTIAEEDKTSHMTIQNFRSTVEKQAAKEIERNIKDGIEKVQKEYKSDVIGLGRMVHIEHRDEWYDSLQDKWEDIYQQIPIEVNVTVDIDSSVLYYQPMRRDKSIGGS